MGPLECTRIFVQSSSIHSEQHRSTGSADVGDGVRHDLTDVILISLSPSVRLRKKRAICPLSAGLSASSPMEPASSKSTLCRAGGNIFQCMVNAVPRHRRICSSAAAKVAALALLRVGTATLSSILFGELVVIIGKPVLVVGEHGKAPFFTSLVVASICLFGQCGVFGRLRTVLLGGEHG
jgi:hypothetical protein